MRIKKNKVMSSLINDLKIEILDSGYALCDKEWNITEKNPYSKLYYIIDGEAYIESDKEKVLLKKGYMYFIPIEYELHAWTNDKMNHLYFHINIIRKNKMDLFYQSDEIIEIPCDNIESFVKLYESRNINDAFKILEQIYRDLSRGIEKMNVKFRDDLYSDIVMNAIEYIEKNISSHLKVDDVAKAVYVSRSKLIDAFNDELEIPVGKYIDNLLVFELEKELILSNLTVEQMVTKYGFCDRPYMVRFFKKKTGYTPKEYRNKMKRFDIKYF